MLGKILDGLSSETGAVISRLKMVSAQASAVGGFVFGRWWEGGWGFPSLLVSVPDDLILGQRSNLAFLRAPERGLH